jgi:Phage integrase family
MGHALARATHNKYDKALNHFTSFCDARRLVVQTDRDVDRHLAHFIQHTYNTGGSFDVAKCAVYGVQHRAPWLARELAGCKLALRGWKRRHPSTSHPPLTWELTCLLATWMALRGEHDAALAMLVGFDCFLRIGEILALKARDVAVANDPRLGSAYRGVMVRLASTKTGTNQSVTVEDAGVARMLVAHLRGRRPDDAVFAVPRHAFYTLFHGACRAFGLAGHNYSPHSLRHGGATRHFLLGRPLADIQFRGRWSNSKSVRTYIQSGRALLLITEVDVDVFAVAADCAKLIHLLLAHAATLRAGRRTPADRKVQGTQAS